ncbi:MAG: hypothetical protein ACLP9L_33350 [Thermoguttaceae bacterium]
MAQIAIRSLIVAWCVLFCCGLAEAQGKKSKAGKGAADWEPVPGYKYRSILGFNVLVSNTVLEEQARSTERRKPLEVLELEFSMLVHELPPRAVELLRQILFWVEWDKIENTPGAGQRATAVYHAGNNLKHRYAYTSAESFVKSNAVEILTMKALCQEHQGDDHRMVLFHEVTHAVHHHLFDFDNPTIKMAYRNAMERHLYQDKYASTDEKEYFAEVSCAYFNHLNYEPKTREELKRYDPVGYHLMELTWGTPEFIAKAQKVEAEKASMPKLAAARGLLAHKNRVPEGIAALEALIKEYPDTKAAGIAKKLLDKQNAAAENAKK